MRSALGATALSTVLLLAGCGGDPEPRFRAEPSAEPTVASSSPAAAPEPEAWEEKTPEGAVAFAKHWTATFSEAFRSGNTAALAQLSAPDCETCNTFIDLIQGVYKDGGSITGDPWRLTGAGWVKSEDEYVVTGQMVIPEQTIRRAGESPEPAEALTRRYIFTITWAGRGWRTERLVRQA